MQSRIHTHLKDTEVYLRKNADLCEESTPWSFFGLGLGGVESALSSGTESAVGAASYNSLVTWQNIIHVGIDMGEILLRKWVGPLQTVHYFPGVCTFEDGMGNLGKESMKIDSGNTYSLLRRGVAYLIGYLN